MTIVRDHKLHEIPVPGKPLGRHVKHDDLSRNFPAKTAAKIVTVKHASVGLPLDQDLPKPWGSCTANALVGSLNTDPDKKKLARGPWKEAGAFRLYQHETKNEGYSTPPDDPGGSGLEVAKAAKQMGMISAYSHAFSIQDALLALVNRPVITGVSWYDSFDAPNREGLVQIASHAQIRGGHEIVATELVVPVGATTDDLDNILVGLWNSWSASWGLGGRFYWSAATWKSLLDESGDVTVPIR